MQSQPKNIIQWNLNGLHKNIDEIKLIINLHQPIAICLQETNLKYDESPPYINNYQYATKNRRGCLRASGGVCILINNSFPWEEIPIHSNIEAVAISITLETKTTLCNIYIPNQFNFTLIDLENIIKQLPRPFIIVGDFNSHSITWGSYKTDSRGKIIEKLLEQDNIVILNNNEQTRINPSNRNLSAIDLTFSTPTIAQRLHWQVLNEIYNSDHLPISIQFISNALQTNYSTTKWNLKNPDWPLFANLLETKINASEFTDEDIDIEKTVSKFTEIIIETAEQTIGYLKPPSKKTPVPWWNNEIKQYISQKNKALKTFIKTRSLEDHIKLKELRAKTRFLVKSNKTLTWRNFTSEIGAQVDPHIMWNKIRSLQGRKKHSNIYLSTNSSLNTDPSSIAHHLGKYFEKNSSNEMYSHDFLRENENIPSPQPSVISPQNTNQSYLNSPITINEVLKTLKKCTSKSTGPDNIPYSFIQNFTIDTLKILLKIYNTIWNNNVFPQNWRNSIIIPISKPGKNKFSTDGYRPISLLNTLCKLLEKIVNQRLIWFLEQSYYLTPEQCGFRKNKGTYNCLSKIHAEIQNTYSENQYLGMISLDLMKAYDTTWKPHILNSLTKVLSQNQMFNFISNFLKTRTFQVRINQTLSKTFSQANGVPQGSSISVTLFLIAINNITQNISPPVHSTLFADDFNIYCRSKNLATVQTHLQQAINNLLKWTHTSGFTFSPEKSQCTVFTRRRNQNAINIKMGEYQLINNNTIKILGIIFDRVWFS